jgi:hypothetical protein
LEVEVVDDADDEDDDDDDDEKAEDDIKLQERHTGGDMVSPIFILA